MENCFYGCISINYQIKKSSIQAKTTTEDEAVHAGNRGEQEEEVDRTASSLA